MKTLEDTLVNKAIDTLRDSQASKLKVYTIQNTLAIKKENGLFDATGYRQTLVTHVLTG